MAGNLQPLNDKFPVVDAQGRPTLYFTQWAQARQIDITEAITEERALIIIAQYLSDHRLQEGSGIQLTPSGNLTDMPVIAADVQEILDQLSATRGAILYRGLLGWAALLPGTAGKVLQTNGPGADPSWATASGGGGGANQFVNPTATWTTNDTGAFATLANAFIPAENFNIDKLYGAFNNATIGNTYNMFVAEISSTGTIISTIATATAFVTTATGFQSHTFPLSGSVTLTAGHIYLIALVITSGTGVSPCRAMLNGSDGYVNMPRDIGGMFTTLGASVKRFWYAQNSAAPLAGVTAASNGNTSQYNLGMRMQF